jgi:DNA invertase Pin-like site-specific DNA recombinase
MSNSGYIRVYGSIDASPLVEALRSAGVERICLDRTFGAKSSRPSLDGLIASLSPGDRITVVAMNWLAYSMKDFMRIADSILDKGAILESLEDGLDSSTPEGKVMLSHLRIAHRFEGRVYRERLAICHTTSDLLGVGSRGRSKIYSSPELIQKLTDMLHLGVPYARIAKEIGVTTRTICRVVKALGLKRSPPQGTTKHNRSFPCNIIA